MGKKLIGLGVALLLVAVPTAANAAKSRTASGEYNTVVVNPDTNGPSASGHITNGVQFSPRKGERFVSIVIEDESGLPARAIVGQDFDGDGIADTSREICGATTAPLKFRPGYDLVVWAQDGPCEDGTGAVTTFGSVTATFTR